MSRGAVAGTGGQATLEVVAAVPMLLAAALIALQLLLTAYTLHLADGAAEAGALALAAGRPAEPAARSALPGWARRAVEVQANEGRVEVRVRPPAPFAPLSEALEVRSDAWARPPESGGG